MPFALLPLAHLRPPTSNLVFVSLIGSASRRKIQRVNITLSPGGITEFRLHPTRLRQPAGSVPRCDARANCAYSPSHPENRTVTVTKLFISNAESDKPLVEIFVDLVESGIGVSPQDIFCASLEGQGIRPGDDFKSSIRAHLDEATCVIALITPNFYGSAFCICELGAVWMAAKSFIPILVPPLEFTDLKAVLAGLQVLRIEDTADLDKLRDEIVDRTSILALSTSRWSKRRDAFLKSLPEILTQLPAETPVAPATHDKTLKELERYKSEYRRSETEAQRLRAIITELTELKDTTKAAAVLRRHSSTAEVFESLVDAAKGELIPLLVGVREALYSRARKENYCPRADEWEDLKRPIETGQLDVVKNDDDTPVGVCPSASDPQVRKAIAALDELQNWLEAPPADFRGWYTSEFDDANPDMGVRLFWDEHLLLQRSKLQNKRRRPSPER